MSVSLYDEIAARIETEQSRLFAPCEPFPAEGVEAIIPQLENWVRSWMSFDCQSVHIIGTHKICGFSKDSPFYSVWWSSVCDWDLKNFDRLTKTRALSNHAATRSFLDSQRDQFEKLRDFVCALWNQKHPKLLATWRYDSEFTITFYSPPVVSNGTTY